MIIYNKLKLYFSVLFHGRTSYQLKSKSISPFQLQRLKTLDSSFTNPSPFLSQIWTFLCCPQSDLPSNIKWFSPFHITYFAFPLAQACIDFAWVIPIASWLFSASALNPAPSNHQPMTILKHSLPCTVANFLFLPSPISVRAQELRKTFKTRAVFTITLLTFYQNY